MNHPPPALDRTHTPGVHPSPEFWILTSGFSPKYETNPIYTAADLWIPQKCETNPISARPTTQNMRNEPNFIPARASCLLPRTSIMRNEPNSTRPTAKKCETNPIYEPRTTNYEPKMRNESNLPHPPPSRLLHCVQKIRNEPNSTRRIYETNPICPTITVPPPPISAKRTQSQPQRTCRSRKMRNEPNFAQPTTQHPQLCKTNPISRVPRPPTTKRAKRAQFAPTAIRPTIQTRKTNPIPRTPAIFPALPSLIVRNEPNSRPPNCQEQAANRQKMKSEPNFCPHQKCETNPIHRTGAIPPTNPSRITRNEPNPNKPDVTPCGARGYGNFTPAG